MSITIDEQVVQMRFDNKQFEAGAKQSMSTLDKLKEKLNFKGAGKKANDELLEMVDTTSTIGIKFDAMAVVAISALNRITNAAISTGSSLVKSLSLDQVTAGYTKYEQQVAAAQTLVNATGLSMEKIDQYMNKLMWYSDETSYGFADMTTALGTMVSAGGDIEKLIPLLEGMGNATSFVGKGAAEFSRAVIQFTQGYGRNALMLEDWKSIEATLGGAKQLKEVFIEVGEELGKIKKGEVDIGKFNETLRDKWLDQEVMEKAFGKFASMTEKAYEMVQEGVADSATEAYEMLAESFDDYTIKAARAAQEAKTFGEAIDATKDAVSTGWMQTFKLIFGNYEEATKLWTDLSSELWELFASSGEARNKILAMWKDAGGRDTAIEGLYAAWDNLKKIIDAVAQAIRDVFPVNWLQLVMNISNGIKAFGEGLELSEDALNGITSVVKVLLLPAQALVQVARVAMAVFINLVPIIWKLIEAFFELPSKIGGVEGALRKIFGDERYERIAKAYNTVIERLGNAFGSLVGHIQDAISGFNGLSNTRLGQTFEKIGQILKPIADWILDRIVEGIEAITSIDYEGIVDWAINGLSFVVDKLWEIKDVSAIAIGAVIEFFKKFGSVNPVEFFNNLIQSILNLKSTIKSTVKGLGVKTITDSIKEETSGLTSIIHGLAESLKALMARLTPAKLLVFGFGVTLTSVLFSVSKAFESFAKVGESVTGTFTSVTGVFNAIQDRIKPNKFQKIAVALLMLAGALVVMSLVDSKKLMSATIAMGALMGGLVAMVAAFALIEKFLLKGTDLTKTLKQISVLMLGVAGSVMILSAAMLVLQQVNFNQVIGPLAAVIATMVSLSLAVSVLAKYTKGELPKNAMTLVAFALAIKIVVSALQDLANADLSGIVDNIGGLIIAVTMIGALSLAVKKISFSTGLGVTVLILDLLVFAKVLEALGNIKTEKLIKGIAGFVGVMTAMLPLFWLSSLAGKEALKMSGALLAMSAAVLLLGVAVKNIGAIPLGDVVKGTAVVSVLMLLFGKISQMSMLVGKESGSMGKSFIAMSVAILLLGVAIQYIGGLDLGVAVQGAAVVGVLLALFALITKQAAGIGKATGTIVAMVSAIGILTAAVMLLTLVPFGEAMGAATVLSTVMLAFGGAMKLIQGTNWKSAISAVGLIMVTAISVTAVMKVLERLNPNGMIEKVLGFSAIVAALTLSVSHLDIKTGKFENLLKTLGFMAIFAAEATAVVLALSMIPADESLLTKTLSLSAILVTLGLVSDKLKARTGDFKNLLKTLGFMAIFAAEAVGVIALLSVIPVNDGLIEKTASLSLVLVGMAGAMAILSVVAKGLEALGKVGASAIKGALIAEAIIGTMMGVILLVGGLFAMFPELEGPLTMAEQMIPRLGAVIGSFFGAIVGGFVGGVGTAVTSALPAMAEYLSIFAEKIKPFLELRVDQGTVDAVFKLSEVVALITAARFKDGIASWLTGKSSLVQFGEELEKFAPHFRAFADSLDGINATAVIAAGTAMTGLGDLLAQVPTEGGLMRDLLGGRDFSGFAAGLSSFATALKGYFDIIATSVISQEQVDATRYATDALIELANKVPESGGLLQDFFGTHDIGLFGEQLRQFGQGLANFFNIISSAEIDYTLVETCAAAGESLANFANKVPAAGGLLQDFFGTQDIGVFGAQLVAFGTALASFFAIMSDPSVNIDQSLVKACVMAGEAFAGFSEKVPRMGGAFEWFTGSKDMGVFGEQIKEFGSGLAGFFSEFKGANITDSDISLANKAMDGFAELSKSIGQTGGLSSFWSSSTLSEYGEQVKKFGEYFKKYYEEISGINFNEVNVSISAAHDMLRMSNGIDDESFSIIERVQEVMNDIVAAMKESLDANGAYSGKAYEIGGYIVEGTNKGIDDNKATATSTITQFGNELTESFAESVGVHSPSTKFAEIGKYIVAGLKQGIEANMNIARNAIIKMGQNLVSTIRGFFGIHSPSTVMRDEVGRYIIEGIAEGITEDMSAEEAAAKKAQNIISAFQSEFDKYNLNMSTSDLDYKLWQAQNPEANMIDAGGRQLQYYDEQLKAQAERVNLANAQWQATLKALGSTAKETQEAQNTYKQELLNLYSTAQEVLDLDFKLAETVDNRLELADLRTTTADRQYELWEAMNGKATDQEKLIKRTEMLEEKMAAQAERVSYAQEEWETSVAEFGKESITAQTAWNTRTEEMINLYNLGKELVDAQMEASTVINPNTRGIDTKTAELEYQLWETMHENATESEKTEKKIDLTQQQLGLQAQKVVDAQAVYQQLLHELGAEADETRNAYDDYLQVQIDMGNKAKELSTLRSGTDDPNYNHREALSKYQELINDIYDDMMATGDFTSEEVLNTLAKEAGYKRDYYTKRNGQTDVQKIVDEALSKVTATPKVVEKETDDVLDDIVNKYLSNVTYSVEQIGEFTHQNAVGLVNTYLSGADNSINNSANGIEIIFTKAVDAALEQATEVGTAKASSGGSSIGKSLSSGIGSTASGLSDTLSSMIGDGTEEGGGSILSNALSAAEVSSKALGLASGLGFDNQYSEGLHGGMQQLGDTAVGVVTSGLNKVKDWLFPEAESTGKSTVSKLANGLLDNSLIPETAGERIAKNAVTATDKELSKGMTTTGKNAGDSLASGMSLKESVVAAAAKGLAIAAQKSTNKQLGIKSPSRVFKRIGSFIDQGLANGITDDYAIVLDSIRKLTDGVVDSGNQMTITPVMDMTSWNSSYSKIRKDTDDFYDTVLQWDSLGNLVPYGFNNSSNTGTWLKVTSDMAKAVRAGDSILETQFKAAANEGLIRPGDEAAKTVDVTITQNNTSPKALSTAEIYRNTKNLFSTLKSVTSVGGGGGGGKVPILSKANEK